MPSKPELEHFVRKRANVQTPDYPGPSFFFFSPTKICFGYWACSDLRQAPHGSFQSLGSKLHVITAAERGREERERGRGTDRNMNLSNDTDVKDPGRGWIRWRQIYWLSLFLRQKFTWSRRNLYNDENWHGKWQKSGLTTSRVQQQVTTAQSVIPTDKGGFLSLKHKATAARIHQATGRLCSVADQAALPSAVILPGMCIDGGA